ncbi:hypothetical protein [Streptomyces salinarius]|nr:hypothetical protein [Streptomyces salinarius]
MTEQERAAEAYEAGRAQRDREAVQLGQDNARIDGAATGSGGGAR